MPDIRVSYRYETLLDELTNIFSKYPQIKWIWCCLIVPQGRITFLYLNCLMYCNLWNHISMRNICMQLYWAQKTKSFSLFWLVSHSNLFQVHSFYIIIFVCHVILSFALCFCFISMEKLYSNYEYLRSEVEYFDWIVLMNLMSIDRFSLRYFERKEKKTYGITLIVQTRRLCVSTLQLNSCWIPAILLAKCCTGNFAFLG